MTKKTTPSLDEFMTMVQDYAKATRGSFSSTGQEARAARETAAQLRGWIEGAYSSLLEKQEIDVAMSSQA